MQNKHVALIGIALASLAVGGIALAAAQDKYTLKVPGKCRAGSRSSAIPP
jgi:hypothetical protein